MRQKLEFKTGSSNNLRAICYTRVSTANQVDKTSLKDQAAKLRAECARRGIEDFIVIEDAGFSGGKMERPGFQEALALLKSGERNLMLSTHLDRFARNAFDVLTLAKLCSAEGWNMVALEGDITLDTATSNGKLILTMMAALAQFQRDQTKEKINSALDHMRQTGTPGLISTELEARIYNLYVPQPGNKKGLSMDRIAKLLNAEGVPGAKGGKWGGATVNRVLQRKKSALARQHKAS